MENVIQFVNVVKRYPLYHHLGAGIKVLIFNPRNAWKMLKERSYLAIDGVSFNIKKGESVALIGRNGAGKSTSLGLVAGVIKPTSGDVIVHGRVASMLELGGGFHPDLTGRENIKLNASLLGLRKKEIEQKIDEIICFSELGTFIDEPIRVYSSGMLAKLGFSVITQIQPDILIIDEVLAVGDIAFQNKCINTINAFRDKGTTILFVSHSMSDVVKICDKVVWIEDHKVKMIGDAKKVTDEFVKTMS